MASRGRQVQPSRVNDGYRTNQQAQQTTVIQTQVVTGPLPSAAELERYRAVVPDMPDRLLAHFEKQSDHRMELEKAVIEGDQLRATLGLLGGFVIAMTVFIGSFVLIALGHESLGVLALLGDFAVVGGAYVYGDWRRRQERNQKANR